MKERTETETSVIKSKMSKGKPHTKINGNNLIDGSGSTLKSENIKKKSKLKSESIKEDGIKNDNSSSKSKSSVITSKMTKKNRASLLLPPAPPTKMDYYATNHSQITVLSSSIDKLAKCRPHVCEICKMSFEYKFILVRHNRCHTGERPFKCEFPCCGSAFADKGTLVMHERIHSGYKPFKCKFCGRDFAKTSDLYKHETAHIGLKAYDCEKCGKGFVQKRYLKIHMIKIHNMPTLFSCGICSRGYSFRAFLFKHIAKSHPEHASSKDLSKFLVENKVNEQEEEEEKLFSPPPQQQQNEPQQLKESEQRDENSPVKKSNNKIYECGGCDKKYKSRVRLKRHRKRKNHPSFKQHQCPICVIATFKTINGLEKHFYSHSDAEREKLLH